MIWLLAGDFEGRERTFGAPNAAVVAIVFLYGRVATDVSRSCLTKGMSRESLPMFGNASDDARRLPWLEAILLEVVRL